MAKVLRCQDVGHSCAFVARGETVEQILQQAAKHAQEVHRLEVTPELAEAVKRAIREE